MLLNSQKQIIIIRDCCYENVWLYATSVLRWLAPSVLNQNKMIHRQKSCQVELKPQEQL